MAGRPKNTEETFVARLDKSKECWEWTGRRDKDGYGTMSWNGRNTLTHRLAYTLWVDEIEYGKIIMHTCDNPPCCNPAHLVQGTHKQNMADAVAKGRKGYKGSKNANSRLSDFQVEALRGLAAAGLTNAKLSKLFNISRRQVTKIVNGHAWADMDRGLGPAPVGELEAGESDSQITASELNRIGIQGTE